MASPPSQPARGSGTTQLEFAQAMTDFKIMFPSMDADVIEAVLRANGGAVDATIDNLLTMSADAEATASQQVSIVEAMQKLHPVAGAASLQENTELLFEKSETNDDVNDLLSSFSHGAKVSSTRVDNPPSYQQATSQKVEEADLINLSGSDDLVLPSDGPTPAAANPPPAAAAEFDLLSDLDILGAAGGVPKHAYTHPVRQEAERVEHEDRERAISTSTQSIIPTQQQLQDIYEENLRQRESSQFMPDSAARAQFLEDERIALMLQNEEFMSELRRDHEFMSALEMEQQDKGRDRDDVGVLMMQRGAKMDEAVFREKLKNMGQKSKRKFAQLAGIFSRRKGAKQLLDQAHDDNLLLNAEPLVQDDSDDDQQDDRSKSGKQKTPTKGKYTSFP